MKQATDLQRNGDIRGFAYALLDADPGLGSYLDNLHTAPSARGQGTGSAVLEALCDYLAAHASSAGLHLWAFDGNVRTCRYYERLGADIVKRQVIEAPGGGMLAERCYAWQDVATLKRALQP